MVGKKFVLILLCVSWISLISAIKVCETYDDFSSGSLDSNKWSEVSTTLDEHFVNSIEGVYHTTQLTPADKEATLQMIGHNFSSGETLEYDVDYESGEGNLLSRIFINDLPGDTGLQTPFCEGKGFATGGVIGYWNGVSCIGQNIKGKYHLKASFFKDHVDVNFTDPNNNTVSYTPIFSSLIPPYKIKISTRTGHNGIVHFDYDNFIICTEKAEPTCNDILSLKPGKSKGLWKHGCNKGILNIFENGFGWTN